MSRSAAAGSHAAPPGMHPEGVLAVVCLDNPRDNTRGKALWTALPSPGPQEECPWRLSDVIPARMVSHTLRTWTWLPPDMERSFEQAASSITFTRSPNGRFSDWHNAPRRQFPVRREPRLMTWRCAWSKAFASSNRSGEKHARAGRGAPPRRPLMPCLSRTREGGNDGVTWSSSCPVTQRLVGYRDLSVDSSLLQRA
jgi:hypothetical protein